jgi:hypothetical protein
MTNANDVINMIEEIEAKDRDKEVVKNYSVDKDGKEELKD